MPYDKRIVSSESTSDLETPALQVMTRVVPLPPASRAQARNIIRLQLDRLSPLPMTDIVFDVAALGASAESSRYVLGVVRKSDLEDARFERRAVVEVSRTIDGSDVTFRFRNPYARRAADVWLTRHAPSLLVASIGAAVLAFAAAERTGRWQAVAEIEASQSAAETETRARAESARGAIVRTWDDLERVDAGTRTLCVMARLESSRSENDWVVQGLRADAISAAFTFVPPLDPDRLTAMGAVFPEAADADGRLRAVWEGEQCV